jgi:hypothetical protein
MATKPNTSLMKNPASRVNLGKGKQTAARKTAAKKPAAKGQARSKPRYARNTAAAQTMSLVTTVLGAVFGAFLINLFDYGVNRFLPTTGAGLRTGVKAAVGAGLLLFGKKLPVGRSYAPMVGGAFILAAALDGVATYLMPGVINLIAPTAAAPQIVSSQPGVTSSGEMGMIVRDSDGNTWEIPDNNSYPQYNDGFAQRPAMSIV